MQILLSLTLKCLDSLLTNVKMVLLNAFLIINDLYKLIKGQ